MPERSTAGTIRVLRPTVIRRPLNDRGATIAAGAIALTLACGAEIPGPEHARPSNSLVREVPYPPPPARVELLPPPPSSRAVWIDGEWAWNGWRWAWTDGQWALPPPGYAFSPWRMTRREDGALLISPGFWRDPAGRIVDQLPPVETGRAPEGNVTRPEGRPEKTAPNVVPSAAPVTPMP